VSTCVFGAIFEAAIGGFFNDSLGRKKTILIADFFFFIGAAVMAVSPHP
jgi:SP family myo-inositol transporter-like MFS transporter 13